MVNYRRGFFRLWLVLAVPWSGYYGWLGVTSYLEASHYGALASGLYKEAEVAPEAEPWITHPPLEEGLFSTEPRKWDHEPDRIDRMRPVMGATGLPIAFIDRHLDELEAQISIKGFDDDKIRSSAIFKEYLYNPYPYIGYKRELMGQAKYADKNEHAHRKALNQAYIGLAIPFALLSVWIVWPLALRLAAGVMTYVLRPIYSFVLRGFKSKPCLSGLRPRIYSYVISKPFCNKCLCIIFALRGRESEKPVAAWSWAQTG